MENQSKTTVEMNPVADPNPKLQKEYLMISPMELVPAAEHLQAFPTLEETEHDGILESYSKYNRLKPVFFLKRNIDGKDVNAVIDGMKYVRYALEAGIEKVYACELTFSNEEDLVPVMVQLQHSNHASLMALFNMIAILWKKYFKGQGYRSDLNTKDQENELDQVTTNSYCGKPLNIYQKIGDDLYLSGTTVKHIRKIGLVNPLHFDRIENSRLSLYAAYLACIAEERGDEPSVPTVKAPVYVSTGTGVPQFSDPTSTDITQYPNAVGVSSEADIPEEVKYDEPTIIKIEVAQSSKKIKCPHCQEEFELLTDKTIQS